MAAYGASISLNNTIQTILQSSRISLVPPSPQILQPVYEAMVRLQKVLLKLDETGFSKMRTKVNDLDERIKEAVWEFEDLLESHYTNQILPQLESSGGVRDGLSFSVDLQSLQRSVDCFVERVAVMEEEYDMELFNMPEEEGEPISSRIDFGGINSKMVGLPQEFEESRDFLLANQYNLFVNGMGVGKTTLVKKVFDDPSIQRHFDHRAWVKVGRKCEYNEILQCILAQVAPDTHKQVLAQGEDGDDVKLIILLEERMKDKKCLIVLDDVWDVHQAIRVLDSLLRQNFQFLLTSRETFTDRGYIKVRLLDEEESKKLLGQKVFGEEGFPPHLDELGDKIVYKCEGLPLMIVTVAELLSEANKSNAAEVLSRANKGTREELNKNVKEYWTEVAEKQHNSVFMDAYNQISEVLFPSYEYLPQYLKMCFLYLGAFPPYRDIQISTIFCQLSAEGFLETLWEPPLDIFMIYCVMKLGSVYNLLLHELNPYSWFSTNMLRVHSCLQHLCKKEAGKIKFLLVLQSCDDKMKDQRRLCVHCNTLFVFKQVYDSIKSDCASRVRSLLCLGHHHKYPVPIYAMHFKLLRVLEALNVRYYSFPLEILKLVSLKYLALTCGQELPVSISNLFHLQFLIIHPHLVIKTIGSPYHMPVEVWDMKEIQHIQVTGGDLPIPNSNATLEKLSTLIGVSAKSCSKEILRRIPNLKKLGITMDLNPYIDDNLFNGIDYISELQNLIALTIYIRNPDMKYEYIVPLSMFPSSVTILILTGLGCPWKHINDIGSQLPNLQSLVLENYAFRGHEWNIESGCFLELESLVIEDTDLVRWRAQHGSLPKFQLMSIRYCYKLQQLDWMRDTSMVTTTTIELVECNPLVVASAFQLPEDLFTVLWCSSFETRSRS